MSPTKIITEDSATARKIRDLLENQAIIETAEIWENGHPLYLFDAHAGYGKRTRSLKEELDRRQDVAKTTTPLGSFDGSAASRAGSKLTSQ